VTLRARALSFVGWVVMYLWNRTIRLRFVNRETPERLTAEGKNVILAFWHGRQFLLMSNHRWMNVVINSSESRDGEIQAGILKRFGFTVVRGSSKRKAERALLGLVAGMRNGMNAAIAVDGPRGPLHEAKPGAVYLAGKLGKQIVPVTFGAKRGLVLDRIWDRYLLPAPFTTGVICYGEPISVRDISEAEIEAKRKELDAALNALTAAADGYFTKAM
jgi:lysophospholipid acyltransferase (LPLAT)-like uncharacterized protein